MMTWKKEPRSIDINLRINTCVAFTKHKKTVFYNTCLIKKK